MFRRIFIRKPKIKHDSTAAHSILAVEHLYNSAKKWRFFAVMLLLVITFCLGKCSMSGSHSVVSKDFISSFEIDGVIETSKKRSEVLKALKKNAHAKALFLKINSPGGTITGSEILYNEIKALSDSMLVVAFIYDVGASGGYLAALGANKIFAHETSITGSIGVLMQSVDASVLAKKVGARLRTYGSSEYKGQPNPFEAPTKNVEEYLKSTIDDGFDYFRNVVSVRRNLHGDALAKVANGKIFTGRQALSLGLIDGIADEDGVISFINATLKEKGVVSDELPVIELKAKEEDNFSLLSFLDKLTDKKHKRESRLYAIANI